MMDWYGGGMGGSGGVMWLLMTLLWVGLIAVIVVVVIKLLPRSGRESEQPGRTTGASTTESPEQILDRMFAVGEIDEETYRSRRTALAEMRGRP